MADNILIAKIEAVLFASGDPVEVAKLSLILKADKGEVANAIDALKIKYAKKNSGITLLELDQSIQLSNKQEYGDCIKEALLVKKNAPLSSAAMEVLAIIAYNQPEPVTKSFIEQIRGVDSSQTVNSLVEKGLIEEAGRHNLPGRPIVYRTTDVFLRNFGISSIVELPPLPTEEEQLKLEEEKATETAKETQEIEKPSIFGDVKVTIDVDDVDSDGDGDDASIDVVDDDIADVVVADIVEESVTSDEKVVSQQDITEIVEVQSTIREEE